AAARALSVAPEAAAGFCGRALGLLAQEAPERPALLALQCRALARASRPAAAVACGRSALAALPRGGEPLPTPAAGLGGLFPPGRSDEAIEVADELVAEGPVPAATHAQRGVLLVFAGRDAEAAAEAAVALAAAPGLPAEQVVTYGQLTILTSMLLRHRETVE